MPELADLLIERAGEGRIVVAVAGAPGSGKSTLAERLVGLVEAKAPEAAAILPMDGYHYDDMLLERLGRRARKGAPDTFDVGGYAHMLKRLRENAEEAVAVPVFDRDIEIARAGARLIPRSARVIVTEGNYLLLRDDPWSALRSLFDVTVFLDVPEETLRERLEARWRGYRLSPERILEKLEENDLPNARLVMARSGEADFRIGN
ncbi:nucleoside triphosphate hydrolase [Oricola thermophila]|uniref:Nucleoside triphosphate hydrolase n=2 Tax=Oricola thermophila TaxID=2742145 RepID=A0A6N1VIK8_9HYPH|nr:nucleoside triphosphate hydrolase [Oricola thermophila]